MVQIQEDFSQLPIGGQEEEDFSLLPIGGEKQVKTPAPKLSDSEIKSGAAAAEDFFTKEKAATKKRGRLVEQASFGAQETLLSLGKLLGVSSEELDPSLERLEEQAPQSGIEKTARFAGSFLPPSPAGPVGLATRGLATASLKGSPLASKVGAKLAEKAKELGTKPKKLLDKTLKAIASLEGGGFNEKIKPLIKESPEILFEPKKGWQQIQEEAFEAIKNKKLEIGKEVGELNTKVADLVATNKVPVKDVLDELNVVKSKFAIGTTERKSVEEIINLVKTGGEDLKLRKGAKKLSALTGDQLQKVVNNIDSTSAAKQIATKTAQGVSPSKGDTIFLTAQTKVKKIHNNLIDSIDDIALKEGRITARGEYANLMKKSQLIGGKAGIKEKQMASKLQQSLQLNKENDFDAFRELLPEGLYNEAISKILNQSSTKAPQLAGQAARPAGQLQLLGEFIGGIVPKTAAVGVAGTPKVPIGGLPAGLIRRRQALGRIGGGVRDAIGVGLGAFPAQQKLGVSAAQGLGGERR